MLGLAMFSLQRLIHACLFQFIMERHSLYRAMTIAKSPVAGYVVQPFTVQVRAGGAPRSIVKAS
jgi:hypothetical protein